MRLQDKHHPDHTQVLSQASVFPNPHQAQLAVKKHGYAGVRYAVAFVEMNVAPTAMMPFVVAGPTLPDELPQATDLFERIQATATAQHIERHLGQAEHMGRVRKKL